MNERITQLVEQARKYANEYVEDEVEKQFHKKFVELIVLECAELVDRAVSDGGVDGRVLKQHFGVEE